MLSKSCLSTIRQTYPTLTAVERRVADYILENGEEVVLMPIADLAKNVGVAKSAVVRCAKSLGFEGYAELKIALTSELSKNKQLNYAPYIDPDDTQNLRREHKDPPRHRGKARPRHIRQDGRRARLGGAHLCLRHRDLRRLR